MPSSIEDLAILIKSIPKDPNDISAGLGIINSLPAEVVKRIATLKDGESFGTMNDSGLEEKLIKVMTKYRENNPLTVEGLGDFPYLQAVRLILQGEPYYKIIIKYTPKQWRDAYDRIICSSSNHAGKEELESFCIGNYYHQIPYNLLGCKNLIRILVEEIKNPTVVQKQEEKQARTESTITASTEVGSEHTMSPASSVGSVGARLSDGSEASPKTNDQVVEEARELVSNMQSSRDPEAYTHSGSANTPSFSRRSGKRPSGDLEVADEHTSLAPKRRSLGCTASPL